MNDKTSKPVDFGTRKIDPNRKFTFPEPLINLIQTKGWVERKVNISWNQQTNEIILKPIVS